MACAKLCSHKLTDFNENKIRGQSENEIKFWSQFGA